MSLHPGEVLIGPVVSEKSYAQIAHNRYTFKVHQDAHKTQVRQAVEQLFDVKVVGVNILKVQPKPKRRGVTKGARPGLEEGRRPAQARRHDRDLRGGSALVMAIRKYKPTSPGPPLHVGLDLRGDHEDGAREVPARAGQRRRAAATTTAASRRATRAAGTSAATASSTSSATRTACRRRSPRSSTTRTGRRASRCSTTPTAPRATSSRRRGCASARRSSPARPPTSRPATRCRSRTSRRARSCTTSSCSPARARRWRRSAGSGIQLVAKDQGYARPAPALGRDAPRAAHVPRHGRPGRQRRPPEHHGRQGGPQPLARQAPGRARLGDEPGRPPARRRRGQVEGRPPPGHAVGRADARQAHAPQAQGIGQADRPRPPARQGEATLSEPFKLEEGPVRRAAPARAASSAMNDAGQKK